MHSLFLLLFLQLKTRLKDTQKKVDAFDDETTRVINELKPLEVINITIITTRVINNYELKPLEVINITIITPEETCTVKPAIVDTLK